MISYILAVIVGIIVLVADQYAKMLVATNFELGQSTEFIKGILDFTYIHNTGGAWGMLSGYTWLLVSVTLIIMLVCIALLMRYGVKNKLIFWSLILVLSGGVGNMIDRIFRDGEVIDFLHFAFFKSFPVFNIADIAIVIGAGLLMFYFNSGMIKDEKQKKLDSIKAAVSDESDN